MATLVVAMCLTSNLHGHASVATAPAQKSVRVLPPGGSGATVYSMRPAEPKLDRHGFPIPPGFGDSGVADPTASSGDHWRRIRFLLRMALLAALLAVVWHHFDMGQKARDLLAQHFLREAAKLYDRNDFPRALEAADRAVRWSPDNPEALLLRSFVRLANDDAQGSLTDIDRAVALSPHDPRPRRFRQEIYHRLGKHREAAAGAGEMLKNAQGDPAQLLNSRAYSRAQGDFELEEALVDINKALASAPDNAAYLDTRGFVLLKLGKLEEAMTDFQKAIDLIEAERLETQLAVRKGRLDDPQLGQFGREYSAVMKAFEHDLAVMIHHRGEVQEKLGKKLEAEKDFRQAERYGYDPAAGVY